jgi:23S rRNA (pseudouridine1915-N3)-methyltransferase
MRLKILWPGKTKNRDFRSLQEFYLGRIGQLAACEIVETREAKGLEEKFSQKILELEARGLEKHLEDDYIICLSDQGQEMNSGDFARFMEKAAMKSGRPLTFIVGGFSGLAERILKHADARLSLSKMTFSHELSRVILLEQIYRSLSILKGTHYAK